MIELKVNKLSGKDKIIGLLNAKKPYAIFFKTRFGIHTFGLKFAIDALILDKNNVVVKISENLKPNRIFLWHPKFDRVIELPAGEIEKRCIRHQSKIGVKFHSQ